MTNCIQAHSLFGRIASIEALYKPAANYANRCFLLPEKFECEAVQLSQCSVERSHQLKEMHSALYREAGDVVISPNAHADADMLRKLFQLSPRTQLAGIVLGNAFSSAHESLSCLSYCGQKQRRILLQPALFSHS